MDLTTTYLGKKLKNPLVASASPLSRRLDNIRRLEDAGASAVVLFSLFEEEILHESRELDHYLTYGAESYAEAISYFPQPEEFYLGPEAYLEHIRQTKEAVGIPIIGSLNGVSPGGWINYARKIESAGADAPAVALDRDSIRQNQSRSRGDERHSHRAGCFENVDGRGQRHDDGLRASAQRRRPHSPSPARNGNLDGRARI